jgi:hypothetical protein
MNYKTFLTLAIILIVISLSTYKFLKNRVDVEGEALLPYTYVSASPDRSTYLGLYERCLDTVSGPRDEACLRLIYYYKIPSEERGRCRLVGGYDTKLKMFEEAEATWDSNDQVTFTSAWSNKQLITIRLDEGQCEVYTPMTGLFELMPSLEGTKRRYLEVVRQRAQEKDRKLLEDATKSIQQ